MTMIAEAVDRLVELADGANDNKRVRVLRDLTTNGKSVMYEHDGRVVEHAIPPGVRHSTVNTLEDMIAAAKRYAGNSTLWVSTGCITLVLDDEDRRDQVLMLLIGTPAYQKLKLLHDNPKLEQAELLRLLRLELRSAIGAAELVPMIRTVKFRQAESGYCDIQRGGESLGKSIEMEVTGADALPELLVVETAVFNNPGLRHDKLAIGCDLETDVREHVFYLRPLPDDLQVALQLAIGQICNRLTEALPDTPVFYGTP